MSPGGSPRIHSGEDVTICLPSDRRIPWKRPGHPEGPERRSERPRDAAETDCHAPVATVCSKVTVAPPPPPLRRAAVRAASGEARHRGGLLRMPPSVGGALKPSAQRVEDALAERGLPGRVVELAASTRTAADAARAVGCEVGQIAKSLVFRGSDGRSAVLVITSGTNRVDEEWMARFAGGPLLRADPEFARAETGFVIGGIPALGHSRALKTFIDRDLLLFPTIWAAAGHPNAVCRLTPAELLDLSPGRVVPVAPEGPSSDAHLPPAWVTLDC